MTARDYYILRKLGIDTDLSDEEILRLLIELADYLFEEVKQGEKERFAKEIKRLIIKPSN